VWAENLHLWRLTQVFSSTVDFLDQSLLPQTEARYPRALMDYRRARAMARAAQPPRARPSTVMNGTSRMNQMPQTRPRTSQCRLCNAILAPAHIHLWAHTAGVAADALLM
jgi:hypothetical protein